MTIYILKIRLRYFDQAMLEYDEKKEEEYWLWALNEQTAINKMRKWKPSREKGEAISVTRDTMIRKRNTRSVDYFVEKENGESELYVAELSVEPCVSIEDAEIKKIFRFA